jgi:hypothetical protein
VTEAADGVISPYDRHAFDWDLEPPPVTFI